MLEKSHLKYIYSSTLYSIAESQASTEATEPLVEQKKTAQTPKLPDVPKLPETPKLQDLPKLPATTKLPKEPEAEVVRKHVLVLYTGKDLNPEESGLLIKILQAVNVKLEDAALVNTTGLKQGVLYTDLIKQYDYSKLISFGTETYKIGLPLTQNTIKLEDNRKYLFTDSLPELAKDTNKKKVLWGILKELFAI